MKSLEGLTGDHLQLAKKSNELGLDYNKARRMLVNRIIRAYFQNSDEETFCYRCGQEIEKWQMLTLDHKEPWMGAEDPLVAYLSLENLSAAHFQCNTGARRKRGGTDSEKNRRPRCPKTGRLKKAGL